MPDKKPPKRVVARLEISSAGKNALEKLCDNTGMTQVQMSSRVVEWFTTQPPTVQAMVLGIYPPKKIEPDIARLLLPALKARPNG